jgi:hypothetical protein
LFHACRVSHGLHSSFKAPVSKMRRDETIEGNANPVSAAPPMPPLQPVWCRFRVNEG